MAEQLPKYGIHNDLPRYGFGYVGGGYDLYVVYDRSDYELCSPHIHTNWVARFRDDMNGHDAAKKKAKELNEAFYGQNTCNCGS